MKMKRLLALGLAALLLCGCAPQTADFAIAHATYPTLTDYSEAYDKVADLESTGWSDYEKVESFYTEYNTAYTAYNEEIAALRESAEADCPDLTSFSANTVAALFADRQDNTVYSPANLYMALAMLAECTDGETREQIAALLGQEDTRTAANALWKMLYQDGRTVCTLANSMWTGEIVPIKQSLANTLAEHYYADSFTVPMGTAEADKALRSWINNHTGNLLKDAAESIQTDPSTVLTLVSTLYFKGLWSSEFNESATYADTFTKADGTEITADFMHAESTGTWQKGSNYTAVSRTFQDRGGRMVFILPDEGVTPEAILSDTEVVTQILTDSGVENFTRIQWSVPKFDVDSSLELSDQLRAMGLTDMFDPTVSDFTPATEATDVFVSQVQHAARVTIDEYGCTAAAFTVMMTCGSAMPPDAVLEFDLDRPFAFMILSDSGLPLFVGTVYEP